MTTTSTADAGPQPTGQELVTFGALASSFNFGMARPHGEVLADVVADEVRGRGPACRVLDIGCGKGIQHRPELQAMIAREAGELWGIEPDTGVQPQPGVLTNFQHALMETANLPESYFDVMYSSMVMEHVEDPSAFFRAVHRALAPGGVYMFSTPNARHAFVTLAKTLNRLKLDEGVLSVLKKGKDEYHYPVQYRCNDARAIDAAARETGFDPPGYAYFEGRGVGRYFKGPMKPLYWLIARRLKRARRPELLATMIVRMKKPAAASGGRE